MSADKTIGRMPPVLILIGLALILFPIFLIIEVSTGSPIQPGGPFGGGLLFAALSAIGYVFISVRVVVSGRQLKFVNFITTVSIPDVEIEAIDTENGFVVIAKDGSRWRSFAFGSSFLGALLDYPRSRRLSKRWHEHLASQPPGHAGASSRITTELRRGYVIGTLAWYLTVYAIGPAIYLARSH